jgi:hypothetical protein
VVKNVVGVEGLKQAEVVFRACVDNSTSGLFSVSTNDICPSPMLVTLKSKTSIVPATGLPATFGYPRDSIACLATLYLQAGCRTLAPADVSLRYDEDQELSG